MKVDPNTDLLPGEQDVLDSKTPSAESAALEATHPDESGGTDDGALNAEALAAIAAKGEPPADDKQQQAAATDDEQQAAAPAAQAPAYNVADPTKFDETRAALLTKRAEALKQLVDEGTMTAADFAAIDAEVMSGLEQLTINRTLHEANVQQEQARQKAVLDDIRTSASNVGIDYADPGLAALFDTKMRALAASPEMAGKSASDIYQATHAEVLKLFGKAPNAAPAPAATPAAAPAAAATPAEPAPKPQIPPTLGALPSAATPTIGNGLLETLGAIENPDDAEAMLMKLPPGQVDQALRATIPSTRRH